MYRGDGLLRLQASITARDDRLLGWLYDHGVLTSDQIGGALFPSLDVAQRRLLRLTNLTAVSRFRPQRWEGGSYPYHNVLDQLGYEHVMGQGQEGMPRPDRARRRHQSLISRADLPHLLGGNSVFIELAAHERVHPATKLARWWPASAFHDAGSFVHEGEDPGVITHGTFRLPRPDGHAVWIEHGKAVPFVFFFEFDRSSEFCGGQRPGRLLVLRGCVGQRLMNRRYRLRQVWCEQVGGVSRGRWAVSRAGGRCRGGSGGRFGRWSRDHHPDRRVGYAETAACGRCGSRGRGSRKTLLGVFPTGVRTYA